MRIDEVSGAESQSARLAALAQFLLSRAKDTDAKKTISMQSFIKLASNMGISLTPDQVRTMSQQSPLNNIITNIEGDDDTGTIVFKGSSEPPPEGMSVDQARQTVDQMAKRAAKRSL